MSQLLLIATAVWAIGLNGSAADRVPYVSPGNGVAKDRLVWGLRDGIRIGLHPNRGPAGLIRIYAPYLNQEYPRVVNFISVEPLVVGETRRGQSELETSHDRPGERGLTFRASSSLTEQAGKTLASGAIDPQTGRLHVFVHVERFRNGAKPIVECVFDAAHPHEIKLITHAAPDSAPMAQCILSATMGNYGQLRRLHLKDDAVVHATELWRPDETLDPLGFLPWRSFPTDRLARLPDGRYHVEISTDAKDPVKVRHDPGVKWWWKYEGRKAVHYWRAEADSQPFAAVNGRRTYWKSTARIPGGASFENFELNLPFRPGQRLWFGVRPDNNQP